MCTIDDDPTETLDDNAVDVEWISMPDVRPLSEDEQLAAVIHRLTGEGHSVEFCGRPRQVIVTRTEPCGDRYGINVLANGRTFTEALHVAAQRLDAREFDSMRVHSRRLPTKLFWPVLVINGDLVDVEIWESPPTTSVAGCVYGAGLPTYHDACEWLQKKIVNYESHIHDDMPTAEQVKRLSESASDARSKTQAMQAAWKQWEADESEWKKAGGF